MEIRTRGPRRRTFSRATRGQVRDQKPQPLSPLAPRCPLLEQHTLLSALLSPFSFLHQAWKQIRSTVWSEGLPAARFVRSDKSGLPRPRWGCCNLFLGRRGDEWDRKAWNVGTLLSSSPQNIIWLESQGLDYTKGRSLRCMLAPSPESTIPPWSIHLMFLHQSSFIVLVSFLFLSQSCELFTLCWWEQRPTVS